MWKGQVFVDKLYKDEMIVDKLTIDKWLVKMDTDEWLSDKYIPRQNDCVDISVDKMTAVKMIRDKMRNLYIY